MVFFGIAQKCSRNAMDVRSSFRFGEQTLLIFFCALLLPSSSFYAGEERAERYERKTKKCEWNSEKEKENRSKNDYFSTSFQVVYEKIRKKKENVGGN